MSVERRARSLRPLTLASALLLSSAIAAPAYAQIEEVVVTAQKKAEDVQTVPIAISAFTKSDLESHQIDGFSDLQFNIPNVSMSNGTYGTGNFQIRGIGTASVTTSADPGVSINENEVYISSPSLNVANYYDIERIEVARGPQGTLFGQNATGGAVNIITAKPQLDTFGVNAEGTYGNYNFRSFQGMVNIPLIKDQLGVRLAGFMEQRDGDVTNIYPALNPGSGLPGKMDSRDDWSARGSLRWQPSDATTVDLMFTTEKENDSRLRSVVQACTNDPSGVLGCLPSARHFQNINLNAITNTALLSNIGPLGGTPFQLFQITGPNADKVGSTAVIPSDMRSVNSDYQPVSVGQDNRGSLTWKQNIFSWLNSTFIGAFNHKSTYARQATEGTPGDPFSLYPATGTNPASAAACPPPAALAASTQRVAAACGGYYTYVGGGGNPLTPISNFYLPAGLNSVQAMQLLFNNSYPTSGAAFFPASEFGKMPISAPQGFGLSSGHILGYADHMQGYDEIRQTSTENSLELRFASNFQGPFNFLFGVSHLEYHLNNNYYVAQTGLDVASIVFGAALFGDGLLAAPSVYDNTVLRYTTKSNGVFGEVYYEIIPDTLKFTGGLRWTEDKKTNLSQQSTLSCPIPIGLTDQQVSTVLASTCAANPLNPFGATSTKPLYQNTKFDSMTGRAVLNWTPKLDWTDQTMVYLSYSHGNRPGGFNPPSFIPGLIPNTFAAENVDAYELGTKNLLANGTVQANADFWYYDYKGYQISSIVNRSSLNVNVNSTLYGIEGELRWAPENTHWQFNLSFGFTHSSIGAGNDMQVDPRNPTHGDANSIVLKDFQGSNCIIHNVSATPASPAVVMATINAAVAGKPVSGTPYTFGPSLITSAPAQLPASVAAAAAYINGSLSGGYGMTCATLGSVLALLNQASIPGMQFALGPQNPATGTIAAPGGIPVSVKGNEMPSTPQITIGVGAQYAFDLNDYILTPRVDYYWKSRSYSSIFNTAQDVIPAWGELNAQLQLNSGDNRWYARAWVKNALDSDNVTGTYTGADAQGLFTNMFILEPRTFGLTVGAHL